MEFEDKSIMCLFNLNSDLLDSVILEVGELDTLVAQALREDGSWRDVKVKVLEKVDKSYKIRIEEKIMPQSQLILKFAK